MTQLRANANQITAAVAILKEHIRQHGGSASDTLLASTVYSIQSALGGVGQPAAHFADVIDKATAGEIKIKPMIVHNDNGSFTITGENPLGLLVGHTYASFGAFDDTEDFDAIDDDDAMDTDDEDEDETLPDAAALKKLNKTDLQAQALSEGVEFTEENTKADLVEAILVKRDEDE